MRDGARAVWRGLRNFRDLGYSYIWANLAFVVLSLPLVTAPAAYSALQRVGHLAYTNPSEADLSAFWDTFRANLLRALPWGVANVAFAVVNFSNLLTYGGGASPTTLAYEVLWLAAGVVWLGMLLYTWPIYYEMETPSVLGATRNALLMVLRNPFFTLTLLVVILVLAVVSTVLIAAWLLLTFGLIAALGNAAVQDRLERYRARP